MKVLLIYPDTDPVTVLPELLVNIEPLGLEYLAGAIPEHDVAILDMKMERRWEKRVAKFRPDLVGITGTVVHQPRMLRILERVKELVPTALTVVGGTHATLRPGDFHHEAVDVIATGQGVQAFRDVVHAHERGRSFAKWATFAPPLGPPTDLDDLPMPRRDLVARHRKKYRHLVWKPTALIVTSVGCRHRCRFCPCPVLTGGKVIKRSPELVLSELQEIDEPYIYAGDDNFFADPDHAERMYELIRDAGIEKQFYVLSRVDSIVRRPDLVRKWASIGLRKVFLGLESVRNTELTAMRKGADLEKNNLAIAILHRYGVAPLGAFIIQPDFVEEDFAAILDYLNEQRIYYHEFTILTPFPGTPFHDEQRGNLAIRDHRYYDLAHSVLPTELPPKEFYRQFLRLYRKASSPLRAYRVRPELSPFPAMATKGLIPRGIGLHIRSRRAYRRLVSSPAG